MAMPLALPATPAKFSFQRLTLVTDGLFFSQIGDSYEPFPVQVLRHVVPMPNSAESLDGDRRDVQVVDSAKLSPEADFSVVRFGLGFLDLEDGLAMCTDKDQDLRLDARQSVENFVARAKSSQGLDHVSQRIARNVLSGKWLARNRVMATSILISVENEGVVIATVDPLQMRTNHFNDFTDAETEVAKVIANGLRGDRGARLTVVAQMSMALQGAIEVYPSKASALGGQAGFSRLLYSTGYAANDNRDDAEQGVGQAAIRDKEIARCLRTIDTWYPGFSEQRRILPIDPDGRLTNGGPALRSGPNSAIAMFARLNTIDPDSDDGMYCIGMMIRGGPLGSQADSRNNR